MVTNRFVNQPDHTDSGFQAEYDKLIKESIQFYGHDVVYLPRKLVNEDTLFGEDTLAEFRENGCIEMFIESVEGFQGDQDFIAKFGIEVKNQITLVVSQSRWLEENINELVRPKEGDLVYLPLTNDLFEIKYVKDDFVFFQQNKNFMFRLTCEEFDYSQEDFDTGIPEIDAIADEFENDDNTDNDPFANNPEIEIGSNAIKDFDEIDPFGDF